MAQNQFVQIPCGKCGTTVWISPAAGVGYCPSCHTPNKLPPGGAAAAGAPGAAPQAPAGQPYPGAAPSPYAAQAPAGMTGMAMKTPGFPMLKVAGAVGLAILVGGAYVVKNIVFGMMKPGHASLSSVGIDEKKGDPDKMILAAGGLAKKWRSDAVFRSVNIQKLGSDGTTDLSKDNVQVEYFSPMGVASIIKKINDDSIKKFSFSGTGVNYKDIWGPTKRWDPAPPASPIPQCTAKMLAAKVGIKPGKFVHASYDPTFWQGEATWSVQSDDPPMQARYSGASCEKR